MFDDAIPEQIVVNPISTKTSVKTSPNVAHIQRDSAAFQIALRMPGAEASRSHVKRFTSVK